MAQINPSLTALVLAGGRSSRFGSDKALAPWNDKSMIETVLDVLSPIFSQILIVSKSPGNFSFIEREKVGFVRDIFSDSHSLGGLFSGLSASPTLINFVCACDMPFLQGPLIQALTEKAKGPDAVVPLWKKEVQPLCAVYSAACLPFIYKMIDENNFKIKTLFNRVKTKFVSEKQIQKFDPDGLSFLDIDTPEEYKRSLRHLKV